MRHPHGGRAQGNGGVYGQDHEGGTRPQQPGCAVDRHGRLGGDAGQVLTPAGRKELADGEPPDDDQGQDGGRSRGVPDEAADTDTDDGDEAYRYGSVTR